MDIFEASDQLWAELVGLIDEPLFDDSPRIRLADVACSLSLEHWVSVRALLQGALLSSAVVVHRAQYEAVTRAIWLTYAASEGDLAKLSAELTLDSEQAAKNMAQANDMLKALDKRGPKEPYEALLRFRDNSWKALNSYAHAGIHSIRRHEEGYPALLVHNALKNANGLAVLACMQSVVLSGRQPLQREILELAGRYPGCMPPPI